MNEIDSEEFRVCPTSEACPTSCDHYSKKPGCSSCIHYVNSTCMYGKEFNKLENIKQNIIAKIEACNKEHLLPMVLLTVYHELHNDLYNQKNVNDLSDILD